MGKEVIRFELLIAAVIAVVLQSPAARAASGTYRINPAESRATIHVGKAGAFSFVAGHSHKVSGPIQGGSIDVDPDAPAHTRVRLTIATENLKVLPAGEPEGDAPKVQEAMESDKVLDVARHPSITFQSTAVAYEQRRGNALDATVTGELVIRGVTKTVTAPVHVEFGGSGLTATGKFEIKQSEFGITPISVGGVVAVKDALEIEFSIAATK